MRIVFIGSVEFSMVTLNHLISLGANIVGVCTIQESKFNSDHLDLTSVANENGIPVIYADNINSRDALNWISSRAPDVIFCFGWSKLLRHELLGLARLGVLGFHPTALPANRGRHPITWALVLGLDKTASSFFFMTAAADSGDILSQYEILITNKDDARSLYDKVIKTALVQITEFLPALTDGSFKTVKQDQTSVNFWRKREKNDGVIDWRMSARSIHNLVRGLSKPYVGAHFLYHGNEIKVWKTELHRDAEVNIEPGKVISHSAKGVIVKCGEGAICLTEIETALMLKEGDYL